jgi:uncharacterized ferritin-like protein (DUF455 family)
MFHPTPLAQHSSAEAWCAAYIASTDMAEKLSRPPSRLAFAAQQAQHVCPVPTIPGRPAELQVVERAKKAKTGGALAGIPRRAELFHRFFHHELQAAELMAWAILRFPDTPLAFRKGLLGILDDEVRHMIHYRDYLATLGYALGAFPVRDWFWMRVPSVQTPQAYCATMGIGLEGGNLDHTLRFAAELRAIGDETGAALQELVHEEEIPHVRFALHWYKRFSGDMGSDPFADFEGFRADLPAPLSPLMMRGLPLATTARIRAGFADSFCKDIESWSLSGFSISTPTTNSPNPPASNAQPITKSAE